MSGDTGCVNWKRIIIMRIQYFKPIIGQFNKYYNHNYISIYLEIENLQTFPPTKLLQLKYCEIICLQGKTGD